MVNGDIKIFSGLANNPLAAEIADLLGTGLGDVAIQDAPDTETLVMVNESVRGCDVYVVQPTSAPVNNNLMQLLLIVDALRRASAKRITAVIPYFGYSRQERMAHGREPISAKVVADMLQSVGVNRIILTDIHAPAMQGFFNIPMETLSAVPLIIDYLKQQDLSNSVIVAPDVGRAKLAEQYAERLGVPLALIHKARESTTTARIVGMIGDLKGKSPVIIDDIISTGGTILDTVHAVINAGANRGLRLAAVHGLLAGSAPDRLNHDYIEEVILTDTVHVPADKRTPNMTILPVAQLFAEAIHRVHNENSVSGLYLLT
jgi:ribose-phosphate pyrophosphokinase